MAQITLKLGETHQVKVTKVEPLKVRPSFQMKNITHYNYVIHVEMKDKTVGWVEYVSQQEDITKVPFVIGVVQWIKCNSCNDIHCTVEPYDPEERKPPVNIENISAEDQARMLVDKGCKPKEYLDGRNGTRSRMGVNISGQGISMAMSYSKDFWVAVINKMDKAPTMTEMDAIIDKSIAHAKAINIAMCNEVSGDNVF